MEVIHNALNVEQINYYLFVDTFNSNKIHIKKLKLLTEGCSNWGRYKGSRAWNTSTLTLASN